MTRDEAREYIRSQLEDYLSRKGINTRKPFKCFNPAHEDRSPSMSFDKKRNKAHCFSCGADYDTLDLISIDYGLTDSAEVFKRAYDLFGIDVGGGRGGTLKTKRQETVSAHAQGEPEQDYTGFFLEAHKHISETDYPQRRGLSRDVVDRFKLGYVPEWRHPKASLAVPASPRLIIPTSDWSYIARDTRDRLTGQEKKFSKSKAGRVRIFNGRVLKAAKGPIFVTEGEIDALSIIEAGGEAVALGSASMINQFAALVEEQLPTQPLVLSLDNDDQGRAATDELVKKLQLIRGVSFYRHNVAGDYKDANEALLAGRESFVMAVQRAVNIEQEEREAVKDAYYQTSAASCLQSFIDGIAASVDTPYIPTGFGKLDEYLCGGLFEGLYVIGAISSLGKTTFALQIVDYIAQNGQDALIFSLEMSRFELMAKSISRLTLLRAMESGIGMKDAKTARGITTGSRYASYSEAERRLIDSSIEAYGEYAGHIFISEGVGDIGVSQVRDQVQKHISLTGKAPVVIVDYIQILAPYNERMTDKQNMDKAVLELKRISRDYKVPVIGVCSFNRANYKAAVTFEAFKESGAIEYSSDVVIGLQLNGQGTDKKFDVNAAKDKNPRDVELYILKNRNGPTGKRIAYEYYPLFNYFSEKEDLGLIPPQDADGSDRE
jgi:replicative DNA helicase